MLRRRGWDHDHEPAYVGADEYDAHRYLRCNGIYLYLPSERQHASANWIGLFRAGERIRLRFINGSAMTFFDVRIPGLTMTMVQSDGNDIEPVVMDEFRIGNAETYDAIVEPDENAAYTIFAQAFGRTGYARGTLAPRSGMTAEIPAMDPRPVRTMADMGMSMAGMKGLKMPMRTHRQVLLKRCRTCLE
jgi:FtsP/CotA-like multicopper oxidase with cupredoxin domain